MWLSWLERIVHIDEASGSNPDTPTRFFMIITSHMLVGAAIGVQSPNIWTAFCFGVISHYLLDFIPHWEYLETIKITKANHLMKIFIDFIIGVIVILIIFWFFPFNKIIIISGIFGALLPDFIEFLYKNFKIKFLRPLVIFHNKIHYFKDVSFWPGLPGALIVLLLSILTIFRKWG